MRKIQADEIEKIQITSDGKQYKAFYDGVNIRVEEVEPPEPEPQPLMEKSEEEGEDEDKSKSEEKTQEEGEQSDENASKTKKPPVIEDSVFRTKLASIMNDNKFDRKQRGRTRGKLDMTRLPKIPTHSKTVFTQKMSRQNKAYNVILLVDGSGSMAERSYNKENDTDKSRAEYAAESAVFLAKSFVGIEVNLQVVLFNHYIEVVKKFDQTVDFDKMYEKLHNAHQIDGNGCNHDFSAMYETYKMFKGQEGKNILILLSDGEPVACHEERDYLEDKESYKLHLKESTYRHTPLADIGLTSGQMTHKEHLHNLVRGQKNVTSLALGIQSESWQVPENTTVNNLEEMKSSLLGMLTRKIKRG